MLSDPTPEQRRAFRELTGREINLYPERGKFARMALLILILIASLTLAGGLLTIYNPFEV